MTYQPVVIGTGIAGWRFLQATLQRQQHSFASSPTVARETEYFTNGIRSVRSAEDLVSNRRLLSVALGAFGLKDDIDNKYFIRRILEDGTHARDALANRLADPRYAEFSKAFGFGPGEVPKTGTASFADTVVARYQAQAFEEAVGTQDETMRIALFARRELSDTAKTSKSDEAAWFKMMAAPPMRRFFETALGFPSDISKLDLDKQLDMFRSKARQTFGSERFEDLRTREVQEKLTQMFLARDQVLTFSKGNGPASVALTLLRNGG